MTRRVRTYAGCHPVLRGLLGSLGLLVGLVLALDSIAMLGGPWVFGPLLPAGGLFVYWLARAAGSQ